MAKRDLAERASIMIGVWQEIVAADEVDPMPAMLKMLRQLVRELNAKNRRIQKLEAAQRGRKRRP